MEDLLEKVSELSKQFASVGFKLYFVIPTVNRGQQELKKAI
jgi:hypothetical protein